MPGFLHSLYRRAADAADREAMLSLARVTNWNMLAHAERQYPGGRLCREEMQSMDAEGKEAPSTTRIAALILAEAVSASSSLVRITARRSEDPALMTETKGRHETLEVRVDSVDVLPPRWTIPAYAATPVMDEFLRMAGVLYAGNAGRFIWEFENDCFDVALTFQSLPDLGKARLGDVTRSISLELKPIEAQIPDASTVMS